MFAFGVKPRLSKQNRNNNKQLGLAENGEVGDKVFHWNFKSQQPHHVLLSFGENPTTRVVHRYRGVELPPRADCDHSWVERGSNLSSSSIEGSWASTNLDKSWTGRYGGGVSWSSTPGRLWPIIIVGLPKAPRNLGVYPRSTKWRVNGGKSVTIGALYPHSQKYNCLQTRSTRSRQQQLTTLDYLVVHEIESLCTSHLIVIINLYVYIYILLFLWGLITQKLSCTNA